MTWHSLLAAFGLCHLIGDFLLQTDWQARTKVHGLSGGVAARALGSHVLTYSLGMLPALIWLAQERSLATAAIALAAIAIPHAIQDDRRVLVAYARRVKGAEPEQEPMLMFWLDQVCHVLTLAALALVITA